MVERLTAFSQKDWADLDGLMRELSATSSCTESRLKEALEDANTHILVIRDDGRIVATGTLCIKHTPEFTLADIEAVVVKAACRGNGYGRQLVQALIDQARSQGAHHIQLTSNPARVAANRLYQELGVEKYDTNCYKLLFKLK